MDITQKNIKIFEETLRDKIYEKYPFTFVDFKEGYIIETVTYWYFHGERYGATYAITAAGLGTAKEVNILADYVFSNLAEAIEASRRKDDGI